MQVPPHLSPVQVAKGFLFLSGQLGFGPNGEPPAGDIAAQTRQTLENIRNTLASHGAGLDDVVKATVWLTRVEDFASFNATYAAVFGGHKPARSTVCSPLMLPQALVEIEVVARQPTG
jgi:2-iminobutanoate/2-iminopropanoate deaminase